MQTDIYTTQVEPEIALLYRKYAPGILAYVRLHLPSQDDAEDLVVEVFLAAIESVPFASLAEKAQQAWLWRVTRNKVIDAYRRAKVRQSVDLEHVAGSLFEDEQGGPEHAALRQEDYQELYAQLQRLPAQQQEILRLRFGQELSCGEIARVLSKQEGMVRVTLARSLNRLRKLYRSRREEA